jgi:hypothetical protein
MSPTWGNLATHCVYQNVPDMEKRDTSGNDHLRLRKRFYKRERVEVRVR